MAPDGSSEPDPVDEIRVYEPSTRPGAPLPHAWIEDEAGNRRPIKDLVPPGRFLLIALEAVRIRHIDGDLYDPRSMWARRREIEPGGAVLVRPDRFVAWRSVSASDHPREDLSEALGRVLARPIGVQAAAV